VLGGEIGGGGEERYHNKLDWGWEMDMAVVKGVPFYCPLLASLPQDPT
jgi:hypothetical protein